MQNVNLIHVTPEAEKLIAYCARVSSDNQENPEYAKLLAYCIKHKHWSIFQMASMCVEITTSRGIAAQILRHRSMNFQEFCVSGDTKITCLTEGRSKKRKIESLYKLQNDTRWNRQVRVYDEKSNTLVSAKVLEVFKTGVKSVYKVTLDNGKTIKSTLDHKFLGKEGFARLESFKVNDALACNGHEVYKDFNWMKEAKLKSILNKTGVSGMANESGYSYHTIRKWLRIHGLQFSKKEVAQYTETWNKGLPSEQQPCFGNILSEESREKMRKASRRGVESNLYKNGNSEKSSFRLKVYQWQHKYKNNLLKKFNNQCALCHKNDDKLQIDHIVSVSQEPSKAFDVNNLQILCKKCHNQKTQLERKETIKWSVIRSIEYVGEEMTYDMEIDHVSHNYVGNGIITHNSQRYQSVDSFQKYKARRQDKKNKQNSVDDMSQADQDFFECSQEAVWNLSQRLYKEGLERNIAKEQMRFILPLNTTTKLYMHGTIRDMIHYCSVRCDSSTQKEHRDIALQVWALLKTELPTVAKAVEECYPNMVS